LSASCINCVGLGTGRCVLTGWCVGGCTGARDVGTRVGTCVTGRVVGLREGSNVGRLEEATRRAGDAVVVVAAGRRVGFRDGAWKMNNVGRCDGACEVGRREVGFAEGSGVKEKLAGERVAVACDGDAVTALVGFGVGAHVTLAVGSSVGNSVVGDADCVSADTSMQHAMLSVNEGLKHAGERPVMSAPMVPPRHGSPVHTGPTVCVILHCFCTKACAKRSARVQTFASGSVPTVTAGARSNALWPRAAARMCAQQDPQSQRCTWA